MNLTQRLKTDPDATNDELSELVASTFSDPDLLREISSEMDDLYSFLREQPVICRAVWDKLIRTHNQGCDDENEAVRVGDITFPVPCCCCGVDPYTDNSDIAPNLDLQQNSLAGMDSTGIIGVMSEYREAVHSPNFSPANIEKRKQMSSAQLFSFLTSKNKIDQQTSNYLFDLLQKNECIAQKLYSYASAASILFSLDDSVANPFASSVVVPDKAQASVPIACGRRPAASIPAHAA